MNGRAITRPTCVLARQELARDPAGLVELLERDRVLVGGDLEDGVARRVDDPLARLLVLFAELLDDLRPGGCLVAEHAATRLVHERVDHVVREPVRIRGEGLCGDDAHQLPVAGRRVLALRALQEPAGDRRCSGLRRAALERLDVPEPERLQARQVQPSDRPGDVPERVGDRVVLAVLGSVGKGAGPDRIQHDDARAGHRAILGRAWKRLSD